MGSNITVPAEFERQSAIFLGCNELLPYQPQVLIDVVAALIDRVPLVALIDGEEQRRSVITSLCDWGLPGHWMNFMRTHAKTAWVRDWGPTFVRLPDSSLAILDAEYNNRPEDDLAPRAMASLLRLKMASVPLSIEGGNILRNGQGLCVTTTQLFSHNAHRQLTPPQIMNALQKYYGYQRFMVLHQLQGEPTGHADMFCCFTAPDVAVVGQYDPAVDPVNANVLDQNAGFLARVPIGDGFLKVVRIPMPPRTGAAWRSYTNVIFANGTLLMPTYGRLDEKGQEQAMETYAKLLPGWEIVGIDCGALIQHQGALRCVSLNVPHHPAVDEVLARTAMRTQRLQHATA